MALASVVSLLASAAHPGHGTSDAGEVAHYLLEPAHVIGLASIATALAVVWWVGRPAHKVRARTQR